jgi:large subunit ribosomal protein L31
MKQDIHPEYYPEAEVVCSCGNTWTVGSTQPTIRTDVCSKCHPFFTGQQRIVDSGGRVERFMKKLQRRDEMIAEAEAEKERERSPDLPIAEIDIRTQAQRVLSGAGLSTAGDIIDLLAEGGDESLTNLKGFGLKSLANLKKRLRARGFVLPGDEEGTTDTEEEEEVKVEEA